MPKIQVLEKHIAQLIAAGEVVERPASVIKELVENSIDANATSVTVEIKNGGVSFIRITDNGCGINREDVPTAFLRHATSKLRNAEDLDAISSLGFRGEALASVCAVTKLEMLTKAEDEEIGTRIVIHGGEIVSIEDAGCPQGTTLIMRDIFYNVPARMKFLKKDISEGNAVANIMDKVALSHPEISFKFIRDKKEILFTKGDNKLMSAVYGVFGREFSQDLIPVNYELDNIKIWGFISKPSKARPNKNMQNFFINGRYIKSKTAGVALDEAFKGSLMVGKFASCVLHIKMDFSMLDINVHPAKIEVRFINEKPIFSAIYNAVKSALMSGDKPKEMKIAPKTILDIYAKAPEKVEQIAFSKPEKTQAPKPTYERTSFLNDVVKKIEKPTFDTKFEDIISYTPKPTPQPQKVVDEKIVVEEKIEIPEITQIEEVKIEEKPVEIVPSAEHKLIGEAFTTYIIIEYKNSLMFIDKHAAHERLLYEKIKENAIEYAQTLLTPVTVTLDKSSYNAVLSNLEIIEKAGFIIEDFGMGTVIVRSAPLNLIGKDIVSSVIEIAEYLTKHKTDITTQYVDWIYSSVACRAAVKGGVFSSEEELITLAKKLEENPQIRYCPHGRPIYLIMKKSEIEKNFGRV